MYDLGLIRLCLYVCRCRSYEDYADGWGDMFAGMFEYFFMVVSIVVGVIVALTCIFGYAPTHSFISEAAKVSVYDGLEKCRTGAIAFPVN